MYGCRYAIVEYQSSSNKLADLNLTRTTTTAEDIYARVGRNMYNPTKVGSNKDIPLWLFKNPRTKQYFLK